VEVSAIKIEIGGKGYLGRCIAVWHTLRPE